MATDALHLADAVRSSRVYDWLIRFHAELIARHADEQSVSDFTRQLRAYLRRAAPTREGEISAAAEH